MRLVIRQESFSQEWSLVLQNTEQERVIATAADETAAQLLADVLQGAIDVAEIVAKQQANPAGGFIRGIAYADAITNGATLHELLREPARELLLSAG